MTHDRPWHLAAVLAAGLLTATRGGEMPIYIDFGKTTYPPPAPDSMGRYWNNVTALSGAVITGALGQDGQTTAVDITITNGFYGSNDQSDMTNSMLVDWDGAVTRDAFYLSVSGGDSNASLRIDGLAPNSGYDLTFYGSRNDGSTRTMSVTIDGRTQSYNAGNMEGRETFTIVTDGSGVIAVQFAVASGSSTAFLGGMSIVPLGAQVAFEPGDAILIDIAGGELSAVSPDSGGRYWNEIAGLDVGCQLGHAINTNGNITAVAVSVEDAFYSENSDGLTNSSIVDWDSGVTGDSFWLHSSTDGDAVIRFEGLAPKSAYSLAFYGSRSGAETRVMEVTVGTSAMTYNACPEGMVTFTRIHPDASGCLSVAFKVHSSSVVTHLSGIALVCEGRPTDPVRMYIDVGGGELGALSPDTQGRYWSELSSLGVGYALTDAVESNGRQTAVDLYVEDTFHSENSDGTTSSSIVNWDSGVTGDSWYLSTASGNTTASFRFENLWPDHTYDLTFYGSRAGGGTRIMDVTIGGKTQSYNAGNPEGKTTFEGLKADAIGQVTVLFGIADGSSVAHLNGIGIVAVPPPPPGTIISIR